MPTFLIAARVSFAAVMWLTVIIGGPMIWFGLDQGFVGKLVFLAGAQFSLWLIYFSVCLLIHRLSLKSPEKRQAFLAKSQDQQGKELGSVIEGY